MKRILERYASLGCLVEVYARPEDMSRFDVGWVLGVDDTYVLLMAMDDKGRRDGLLLRLLENIACVQADTLYLKTVEKLSTRFISGRPEMPPDRGDLLEWMIRFARDGRLGISLEIAGSGERDVWGTVERDNGSVLSVRQLDAFGADDGMAHIPHEQITRMDCDSADERARLFLAGR